MTCKEPQNAKELMETWQKEHDTSPLVLINNRRGYCDIHDFFPEALELLCQAIEKGSFYKGIEVRVEGRSAIRAVLGAVLNRRLPNTCDLNLINARFSSDGDGHNFRKEAEVLSECVRSGALDKLQGLSFKFLQDKQDPAMVENSLVVSSVATGKAPNLEVVEFEGLVDEETEKAMVEAILEKKLVKLQDLACQVNLSEYLGILRIQQEFSIWEFVDSPFFRDYRNKDILAFLQERWNHGEVQLATAKVIVTGPSAAGKTCLVNCLKGNAFVPDPKSTNTMETTRITVNGGLELLYYDFGGQRVYTTSHQFFLQTNAVFLVVWDRLEETGGDAAVDQYARDVLDANPDAKMIFVTTKGDVDGHKPLTDMEITDLKKRYGDAFQGYYDVSAKANVGVDELMAAIQSSAGFADLLMPKRYLELRDVLTKLRQDPEKWYITRQEWDSICESVGIKDPRWDLKKRDRNSLALRLFQDMGEVVSLSTGHLVVKPSVLVGVLSRVITRDIEYTANARGGYLRHNELNDIWSDYPVELHKGFLDLIHSCEIGFPVRDTNQDYEATLIPAMMDESSGEDIHRGLKQLLEDFPDFAAAPQILLDLSNLSNQLWTKLLVKLRGLITLGGWWPDGCIVIDLSALDDGTKAMRSFGAVLLDYDKRQVSILNYGRSPSSVQLLRRRTLNALTATLEDFPGVDIERLYLKSSSDANWSVYWSEDLLFRSCLETSAFEKLGTPDVLEWVLKLQEERQTDVWKQPKAESSSFRYFMDMLREDSGVSDELLSYLLLMHQKDMLKKTPGRLDLSALWLIYDHKGSRMAYPFCPHLHPQKIRVSKDMEVSGVSDVDLQGLNKDQIALKSLVSRINERLKVRPPRYKAEFLGIVWNESDEEYIFHVQDETKHKFQPVQLDGFFVFVHESDQDFFTSLTQVKAIEEFTRKVKQEIHGMRKLPTSHDRRDLILALPTDGKEHTIFRGDQCEPIQESLTDGKALWLVVFVLFLLGAVAIKRSMIRSLLDLMSRSARKVTAYLTKDKEQTTDSKTGDREGANLNRPRGEIEASDSIIAEVDIFHDDPFRWLCENFRNGKKRKDHMESVLTQTPITANMANTVKSKVCELVKEDFLTFYPKVIISYSTEHRKDYDADCAGPGLMVAAAVIELLFDKGYPCYSDIITPPGRGWPEYMLRVEQAKVMIVLITRRFCRSINCLKEVSEAIDQGVELIPVRCHKTSDNGIDIARDREAMWPDEELQKYTRQNKKKNAPSELERLKMMRFNARKALCTIGFLPPHGTFLGEPVSVDQLVKRVGDLV